VRQAGGLGEEGVQRAGGGGGERGVGHGAWRVWYKPPVGNIFAIVAFALLWLFLLPFFFTLLRALGRQQRRRGRGEGGGWEHGL
jgi:hypothetical protein